MRVRVCDLCGLDAGAEEHQDTEGIAARDVTPETDGGQRYRFIRGSKP